MESQQYYGHEHPVSFNEELSNQSETPMICSRCKKEVSGPSFTSTKNVLRRRRHPSEIAHPFHRQHPLILLQKPPYNELCPCDFCGENCENFVYHCSCQLDLHIQCALFTYNLAKKNNCGDDDRVEKQNIARKGSTKSLERDPCYGCRKPLLDSTFFFDGTYIRNVLSYLLK